MWGDGIFNQDRFKALGITHTKFEFHFPYLNIPRVPAIAFDFKDMDMNLVYP
jgi:hypothetical protein